MKIMLVCAAGLSTSILMSKMKKWAESNGVDLKIEAYGLSEYTEHYKNYDCVLLGPQISYKADEIMASVGNTPTAQIDSMDYGMGRVENIIKQVEALLKVNEHE